FHNKRNIAEILARDGHALLPLPPYSPDLNPIEQSFAVLKKRREFTVPPPTLETLMMSSYGLR
ncbi:transposase, partial [Magnetococcus sp. PR-3]|uniref:transposase n=1 Tax=Magnetococcus sp. PR-3 TaxID=3120355 RepID=UPI002FCE40CE